MKHWYIRIAHAVIHIQSDVQGCFPILDAMMRLYEVTAPCKSDVEFSIEYRDSSIVLVANGEVLWGGYTAEETVAGFEVFFYGQVLLALQPEYISIHSACISVDDKAVMLAGISGAGKSSSCTAALLGGAEYLSDEFSLLNAAGEIQPFPRPLQWGKQRHPAFRHKQMLAHHFSKFSFRFLNTEGKKQYNLFWFPPRIIHHALPLRVVVFPTYDKHVSGCQIRPMLRSQAMMELRKHMHIHFSPEKNIRELNKRLPNDVMFWQVRFSNVYDAWDEIKKVVES